jgi:hypothetical protein
MRIAMCSVAPMTRALRCDAMRNGDLFPEGRVQRSTPDLFPETKPKRRKPRVLMHVCDAGDVQTGAAEDLGKPLCRMRCKRCRAETGWLVFDTVTEAKRGVPCKACNQPRS